MNTTLRQSPHFQIWETMIPHINHGQHKFRISENTPIIIEDVSTNFHPEVFVTAVLVLHSKQHVEISFHFMDNQNYPVDLVCLIKPPHFSPAQQEKILAIHDEYAQALFA